MLLFVIFVCSVNVQPSACNSITADSVHTSPAVFNMPTQCLTEGNERAARLDYPEWHYPKIVCVRK